MWAPYALTVGDTDAVTVGDTDVETVAVGDGDVETVIVDDGDVETVNEPERVTDKVDVVEGDTVGDAGTHDELPGLDT